MNTIIITGNLGADVEKVNTQNGTAYYRISVATTENWKNQQGEKMSHTTWHKCMLYGNYEKLAQYLTKGTTVSIKGTQRNDVIEFKSNGQVVMFDNKPIKYSCPFVKVYEIELVGGQKPATDTQQASSAQPSASATASTQPQNQAQYNDPDDGLPF